MVQPRGFPRFTDVSEGAARERDLPTEGHHSVRPDAAASSSPDMCNSPRPGPFDETRVAYQEVQVPLQLDSEFFSYAPP